MQQFNSAGRTTPRAALHGDERSVFEEAFAASVEWNMVRMDLLTYCNYLFMSYNDAMMMMCFSLLLCGVGRCKIFFFNPWDRRFALFQPDIEKIRQLSPFRDSWLMQEQKAKRISHL